MNQIVGIKFLQIYELIKANLIGIIHIYTSVFLQKTVNHRLSYFDDVQILRSFIRFYKSVFFFIRNFNLHFRYSVVKELEEINISNCTILTTQQHISHVNTITGIEVLCVKPSNSAFW